MANGKSNGKSNGNGNMAKRNGKQRQNGNNLSATAISYAGNASNTRPVQNQVTKLSGSDFLSVATVRANVTGSGKIISTFPVSPSAYPGTRLTQLSNLWEFFKFDKFHVRWVPAVPTTLACQFVFYVDLDPSDDPTIITDEDALIRQAVAQTGSQQWNFHVPKRIPMALRADRQYFFTGADVLNQRFSQQGKGYLIQITNPINFNGESLISDIQAGSLFIDWTVSFTTPQINPSAVISALGFNPSPLAIVPLDPAPVGNTDYILSGLEPGHFYVYALRGRIADDPGSTLLERASGAVVGTAVQVDGDPSTISINTFSNAGYTVFEATTSTRLITVQGAGVSPATSSLLLTDLTGASTLALGRYSLTIQPTL
jgi:hypothetical protein